MASHSSVTVNEISDPDRACKRRLNGITSIWDTVWEIQQTGSPSLESGNIRCSKFRIECRPDISRSRSGPRCASGGGLCWLSKLGLACAAFQFSHAV